MEIYPHNRELRLLTTMTRRLPGIRGAGVIGNKLASFYTRRRRHAVLGDVFGMKMMLDPHDSVDSHLLFMPHLYEHEEVRFLRENIAAGDTFIDIGANIGFYSLLASKLVGDGGRVRSVEAVPATFEILKKNIELNNLRNIISLNLGVSSRRETLTMVVAPEEGLRRNRGGNSFLRPKGGAAIDIPCKPLRELMAEHGVSGRYAVKVDTEGFEYRILKAFLEHTGESKPHCVLLEQHPHELEGDAVALLEDYGYDVSFRTRRHNYAMTMRS